MSWLVIMWTGQKWKRRTKINKNFMSHVEEFNALRTAAPLLDPPVNPLYYKSIHTCWLTDIKDWESPEDEAANLASPEKESIDVPPSLTATVEKLALKTQVDILCFGAADMSEQYQALNSHDKSELRKFIKYLRARQKYGDAVLLKRRFWRRYLGVDDGKEG